MKSLPLIAFLSLLLTCAHTSLAQAEIDTLLASTSYKKGDALMKEGNYDSSAYYMEIAADIFEQSEQWQKLADALNTLSEDHWRMGRLDAADEVASKAQTICQTYLGEDHIIEADALNNLGNIKIMRGKLSESLVDHEAGLAIKKKRLDEFDPVLAGSYSNIGVIYDYLGDYDRALNYYQKALEIDEKVLGGMHADIAMSYNNIGSIYQFKGDHGNALKYYEKALEVDLEVLGAEHPDLGDIYNNIGTIHYYNGSFDLAGDFYEKALRIRSNSFENNHPKVAESNNNLGNVLFENGDLEEALKNYLKALKIREEVFGPRHAKVISVYHNLGALYDKEGDSEKALESYHTALEISQESLTENHPDIAKSHGHLGRMYEKVKQYDLALFHLNNALEIYQVNFGERHPEIGRTYNSIAVNYNAMNKYSLALENVEKGLMANSDSIGLLSQGYNQHFYLNSLRTKAQTFYRLHTENEELEYLQNSLNTFLHCDTLMTVMRNGNLRHNDKLTLGASAAKIYPIAIVASESLFEKTGDLKYRELSFYFSEKNKGVTLSQSLFDEYAKGYAGIPESTLELERTLLVDESFYRSEILGMKLKQNGYDSGRMHEFENRLFDIKSKVDSLKKSYEQNYPEYYELKYANNIMGITGVQDKLKPSQVVVEYIEAENEIFVFTIQKDQLSVKSIPMDSAYDAMIDTYLSSLDFSVIDETPDLAFENYTKSSYWIYQTLLMPVLDELEPEVTQLIIVPDGKLSYAPWDILLTSSASSKDYKALDYLLKDYSISYAHSASVLFNQIQNSVQSSQATLAFAPTYEASVSEKTFRSLGSDFRDELTQLKWNRDEINTIGEYYSGDYFEGNEATENQFKQVASEYQILHLAMHAFVDNTNPMNSKLVFTQNQDSVEDGMLHAYELFNMDLNAELAVLSACNTGIGKIQKGEGVMSLGRAFSYAGCQSVVMSHWSVDDKTTSLLMNSFYKYLADGATKNEAMRQAKLDFIQNTHGIETHPYYWGGFVVLGNTDPLSEPTNRWMFIVPVVIVLIVIVGANRRRKRSH